MNKTTREEAERIADELMSVHQQFLKAGSEGLNPLSNDTYKLARALRIFEATADVEMLPASVQAQSKHDLKL